MNHLHRQILIWIGKYFPSIPRIFGIKIVVFGYTDITPDMGYRPKSVESKVSWLVKSESQVPLVLKVVVFGNHERDAWLQIYPVNRQLYSAWDRDISCGKEEFDAERRQKSKSLIIPAFGLVKIDYFTTQNPHPCCSSNSAFQLVTDEQEVIILQRYLLNQEAGKWGYRAMQCFISAVGVIVLGAISSYFWVSFCAPV